MKELLVFNTIQMLYLMIRLLRMSPVCFQCYEIMCLSWDFVVPSWSSPWFMSMYDFLDYCVCQRREALLETCYVMLFGDKIHCSPKMSLFGVFLLNKKK